MSRVRSFFLREAGECLVEMGAEAAGDSMDVSAVYGAVRRLRGSAQMARFEGIARTAAALERRLRPYAVGERAESEAELEREGTPAAEAALRSEVREVLTSLHADLEAVREGRLEAEPRMEAEVEARDEQDGADERGGPDERGGRDGMDGPDGVEVVPIETLEYQGEAALERALELRPAMEAVVDPDASRPVLDELFDLIRLGAK